MADSLIYEGQWRVRRGKQMRQEFVLIGSSTVDHYGFPAYRVLAYDGETVRDGVMQVDFLRAQTRPLWLQTGEVLVMDKRPFHVHLEYKGGAIRDSNEGFWVSSLELLPEWDARHRLEKEED